MIGPWLTAPWREAVSRGNHSVHRDEGNGTMLYHRPATCEECGASLTLDTIDPDGTLIGAECSCGYYVTRYMPGQAPK